MTMRAKLAMIAVLGLALAGCESSSGGDPGAMALPAGKTCQTIRADLNRMDGQGAQSKVEAARSGRASAETKAFADRYNQLLNEYLGARCHV